MSSSTQTTEHSSSLTSIPGTSTFSFTAPLPGTKQRRVSLALPSSPRQVTAWTFRDDTGVSSHVAETTSLSSDSSQPTSTERKGKMRKIDPDEEETVPSLVASEKKQRKKWTTEETQMLVDGCNIVYHLTSYLLSYTLFSYKSSYSTALVTGNKSCETLSLSLTIAHQST
jgi:hypothetical protein